MKNRIIWDERQGLQEALERIGEGEKLNKVQPIGISFVVICKNEERCIARCVESLITEKQDEDEIIIYDTGSTDRTLELLDNYKNNVVVHKGEWKNDFSLARNAALRCAIKKWVFFVDADEVLQWGSTKTLKEFLYQMENVDYGLWAVCPIIEGFDHSKICGVPRIFKNDGSMRYFGYVHEEPRGRRCMEHVTRISISGINLWHDGYLEKVVKEKNKVSRNVELDLQMLQQEPQNVRWWFFYARDGREVLGVNAREKALLKVLALTQQGNDRDFRIKALSTLVELYIENGNLKKAIRYHKRMKAEAENLSDTKYFDVVLCIAKFKKELVELLYANKEYRENHFLEEEFGSMHSEGFHLDYANACIFYYLGEYQKANTILLRLREKGYRC